MTMIPIAGKSLERFWRKVDKSGKCWVWTAATTHGYGRFVYSVNGVKNNVGAHRLSFEMVNGPIPDGLHIDHKCRNRSCVNPKHLRLATQKQNGENLPRESHASSGFRGVNWAANANKWQVFVTHNKVRYDGGRFDDLEAAKAKAVELRNSLYTHNDDDRSPDAKAEAAKREAERRLESEAEAIRSRVTVRKVNPEYWNQVARAAREVYGVAS